ncbi:MAG: PKD domain-containing protein [Crocinitomicaceae bacterium]|nr:PKD domain-containing protein [Crocinitomicaceae bacterium]
MKYLFLLSIGIFHGIFSFSQTPFEIEKRDYIWLFGFEDFGGSILDFNHSPVDISSEDIGVDLNATSATICTSNGNLRLYTNGIRVLNYLDQIVENGDTINPGQYWENHQQIGYILNQGTLFLPFPESDSLVALFHESLEYPLVGNNLIVPYFYQTTIDISANDLKGKVLQKNIPIIEDSLAYGEITTVRHANGRDWWIIVPEYNSNKYYKCLFTPNGIDIVNTQTIGNTVQTGLAQATFTPDGSKYIRFNTISLEVGQFIHIYDFDRCSGLLHTPIEITYNDSAGAGGVAVSPNSKYLYVSSNNYIYQYDLTSIDIEASKVIIAEYDGFQSPFATRFFLAQLAPDDQIYINSPTGVNTLHVIREPNRLGIESKVDQHAIQLPTINSFTLANNPYYGLGPLDGSYCDTLGLDNHPIAYFRHTESGLEATFTDYSKLAPTDWFWKFGDGQTSEEINPIHQYEEPGMYNVCLTVSNENNSHEFCDSVQVILTTTNEPLSPIDISIYPNPSRDYFFVSSEDRFPNQSQIIVYNLLGQEQIKKAVDPTQTRQLIDVSYLPKGVYVIQIVVDGKVIGSEKVLKQ